ncbi:MAG: DUF2088 domain-containing protein, partial [Spirochaetales bacterium]|nr:DUF2088 domain-containing protein [Spirochaetales bacterium]
MPDSMVTVRFPYSEQPLSRCRLPRERLGRIYDMRPVQPAADLSAEIRDALEHPIGCPPLRETAGAGDTVALLVDDLTRPTPAHAILPVVIAELLAAGVRKKDISIVIALGSHRPMSDKEIAAKVGCSIVEEHRV